MSQLAIRLALRSLCLQDAEDVAQQAVLEAWLHEMRGGVMHRDAMLRTIVRRRIANHLTRVIGRRPAPLSSVPVPQRTVSQAGPIEAAQLLEFVESHTKPDIDGAAPGWERLVGEILMGGRGAEGGGRGSSTLAALQEALRKKKK